MFFNNSTQLFYAKGLGLCNNVIDHVSISAESSTTMADSVESISPIVQS